MSKLVIGEKPSQALDLAKALGLSSKHKGYYQTTSGYIVSYAIGHLLRQLMPKQYNPDWGNWYKQPIPMVPPSWKFEADPDKVDQLMVLKDLLAEAEEVIIACDAGREGELIAREVMDFFNYKGKVKRLWLSTLTEKAILDGFNNLKDGTSTENLYQAALARSHADYLWGLNLTPQTSLAAKKPGLVLPIGRVQTPTLAMLVNRHLAIENFKPDDYFDMEISVSNEKGEKVTLKCSPKEEERLKSKAEAEKILAEVKSQKELPLEVVEKDVQEKPPLFHTLSSLQADANRIYGMSAADTLKIGQSLYDRKLMSYPRTDSAYLGETHLTEVTPILKKLKSLVYSKDLSNKLADKDITLRPSTFDDAKLTDHHGIIPTGEPGSLSDLEQKIFDLILRRFLQQLSPDCLASTTQLCVSHKGYRFLKSGKVIKKQGWRAFD